MRVRKEGEEKERGWAEVEWRGSCSVLPFVRGGMRGAGVSVCRV